MHAFQCQSLINFVRTKSYYLNNWDPISINRFNPSWPINNSCYTVVSKNQLFPPPNAFSDTFTRWISVGLTLSTLGMLNLFVAVITSISSQLFPNSRQIFESGFYCHKDHSCVSYILYASCALIFSYLTVLMPSVSYCTYTDGFSPVADRHCLCVERQSFPFPLLQYC